MQCEISHNNFISEEFGKHELGWVVSCEFRSDATERQRHLSQPFLFFAKFCAVGRGPSVTLGLHDRPGAGHPDQTVIQTLLDYYRVPAESLGAISLTADSASGDIGFFQFGAKNICYGRCQSGVAANVASSGDFNASKDVRRDGKTIQVPFDFTEVVENLRLERYRQ